MKILLVILFILLVPTAVFCLWVLMRVSGMATDKEEQMEIERKLRESNEERKSTNNKKQNN